MLAFLFALAVVVGVLHAVNALIAPLADIIADDVVTLLDKEVPPQ